MPVQAKIESGIIEGDYNTQTGIQTYFGVPFAKPPVGELRWKAPVPAEAWSGVKKTKLSGHVRYKRLFLVIWDLVQQV